MNSRWTFLIKKVIKKFGISKVLIQLFDKIMSEQAYTSEINDTELPDKRINWSFRNEIKEQFDLHIIIPVYNAERYLDDCMRSVLSQKTNFTYCITLVNDGSLDRSADIISKYESDSRIYIVNKENGGAASARNKALEYLLGRYVMFLDADDILYTENALDVLLATASNREADIVEGGYEIFDGIAYKAVHEEAELVNGCGVLWGYSWGKVIKSELFRGVCFPEGFLHEDTIMSYLIYTRSKRTITIKDVVYGYRKNPNGFSHVKGNDDRLLDSYWVLVGVLAQMKNMGIEMNQQIYDQVIKSIITACTRVMLMDDEKRIWCMNKFSLFLEQYAPEFSATDKYDRIFENAIKRNQYGKVRYLCGCFD